MPVKQNGFKAWISCGDDKVTSQSIELGADRTEVTCWIASEAGKEFSVNWIRPAHLWRTAMRGEVLVDDIKCRGIIMHKTNTPGCIYSREGLTTSSKTVKPFIFGRTGEFFSFEACVVGAHGNGSSATPPTGEIKLTIWRVAVTRQENDRAHVTTPGDRAASKVQLGTERGRQRTTNNLKTRRLDSEPLVTFTFKYQPGYKDFQKSREGYRAGGDVKEEEGESDTDEVDEEDDSDEEDEDGDEEEVQA
ncbi:hypothetical protein HWV62_34551 [Athelia sp. TMB]|nr:hypothetical protein HWV62_34551 [Athelia sp. TMB]